jgi:hypothetical protein
LEGNFMIGCRSAGFLVILVLVCLVFGQKTESDEKERARQRAALLDQIAADIPELKLAENRALAYARVGGMIWNDDQKRGRSFFLNAVNELMNAQASAETNHKASANQSELLTGQSTRPQILNAIASRDAQMALDMLVKTRPAAIAKALAIQPSQTSNKISNYSGNSNYLAQNEINMEQNFMRMAADQDPSRAEKLIKDALSKGVSGETLELLRKLAEKNSSEASDLASQVIDKMMQAKLIIDGQPNYQNSQMMVSFLNDDIAHQKPGDQALKFDPAQMRAMADRLISYYLDRGSQEASWLAYSITPIAEKYEPGTVDRIKTIAKNTGCRGCDEGYDPDVQKLLGDGDTTVAQLIAAGDKSPRNQRQQLYQTAANRMLEQGDMASARQLLSDKFSDDSLEEVLRGLDWQYTYTLINQGRFQEAEQMIDSFPEASRLGGLINLATTAYQRDPVTNKAYALAVIGKARDLIGDSPENSNEMQNLMQIVNTLTNMDPSEAIRVYESLVPQMNELSDAAAKINEFQGGGNVRNGEFLMSQGNSFGFYGADFSPFRQFAKSDFDRTMKLIDGFSHREVRVSLKLQLAEGY